MKKIFLMLVFALTFSMASAWERRPDEGVFLLAKKHLSPEAKAVVEQYLGTNYNDDVYYLRNLEIKKKATHSKELRYLHLSADLKPIGVEGEDALKGIEQSLAVIRDHKSQSKAEVVKAFRIFINLMCEMHNMAYIRIEGYPQSQADFTFTCYSGDYGKRKTTAECKWVKFWDAYTYWHGGFSGDLWAEDMELCLGEKRAELSKGSLYDWATSVGKKAAELYSRVNPTYVMTRRERNELEDLNYEMMTSAGYRMAVLLNEALK
jgi:hypothetical protein